MPETNVPGIAAKRVVIQDACRAAHGDGGAFNKAAFTLLAEYDAVVRRRGDEKGVNYHLVLTVEDTKKRVVTSDTAHCCHIGCDKEAEWVIVSGPAPDDYTEACTDHVGDLLCDAPEQKVYPIAPKEPEKPPHASPLDDGVVDCGT